MTAPPGSDLGHRSLGTDVDGTAWAVSLIWSTVRGMASPAWGLDCLTIRHWCGVVLMNVCGQTRGSAAVCTAVMISGRQCVLGAEPSKWFDSVRIELLGTFATVAVVSKLSLTRCKPSTLT